MDGEEWDLVQKGQPLAVGELKGVRNTQDCEKEWGVLLEETRVCS